MVTHINIAVDDELAAEARAAKDSHDWTWEEFFAAATEEFGDGCE